MTINAFPIPTAALASKGAEIASALDAAIGTGWRTAVPALVNDLTTGGTGAALTAEQGKSLKGLIDAIVPGGTIVDDLVTGGTASSLSAQQGVVLKGLIDALVIPPATTIIDDLTTGGSAAALSAQQGVALKALIDALVIPTVPGIADNLTTNDPAQTLSAAQGVALKGLIDGEVTRATGVEATKADMAITVTGTGAITGGGDLSANRTFDLAPVPGVAGSYTLASVTIDGQGRVTSAANGTVAPETLTTLTYNAGTKTLTYTPENGVPANIDLSGLAVDFHVDGATISGNSLTLTVNDAGTATDVTIDLSTFKVVNVGGSIVGDGDTASLQLQGDNAAPAALSYYGTDAGGGKGFHLLPVGVTVVDNLTTNSATQALSAGQGLALDTAKAQAAAIGITGAATDLGVASLNYVADNSTVKYSVEQLDAALKTEETRALGAENVLANADITAANLVGNDIVLTRAVGDLSVTLPPATTVVDDLVTGGSTAALSAAQGVVLNANDIAAAGHSVVGNTMTLLLKGGSTIAIDVTSLANIPDVRLSSGAYNAGTESIDFTLTDASVVSVPVASLLPVTADMSIKGTGISTDKLRLDGDVAAPAGSLAYGTSPAGVKGWVDVSALLDATNNGVPLTGKFSLGFENGVVTLFPIV